MEAIGPNMLAIKANYMAGNYKKHIPYNYTIAY